MKAPTSEKILETAIYKTVVDDEAQHSSGSYRVIEADENGLGQIELGKPQTYEWPLAISYEDANGNGYRSEYVIRLTTPLWELAFVHVPASRLYML